MSKETFKIKKGKTYRTKDSNVMKCLKGKKDCKPLIRKRYAGEHFLCSGYVKRPRNNLADRIRICDHYSWFGDFTPDEALTFAKCLIHSTETILLHHNKPYKKWRKECFLKDKRYKK